MKKNFWRSKVLCTYSALNSDIETECAVIGGGLAGIMCAAELFKRGQKVCVLEAQRVGCGDTSGSSGMISFAHDLIYYRLMQKHGEATAKTYLELNKAGAEKIRNLIKEYNIDCGLGNCDMYLYAKTKSGLEALKKERRAYAALGYSFDIENQTELPFETKGALKIPNQGYLNPYLFTAGLAGEIAKKGVKIYENTRVIEQPKEGVLRVGEYVVKAKNFIVCTHFPYINAPGFYFFKMYQSRSSNIVFKTSHKISNKYESAEEKGFEYRPANDSVLCGGASVRCGKYKHSSRYEIVKRHLKEQFEVKDSDILSQFAAQDCMTFDMLPFAGNYGTATDNIFVITGFNKWGFTNSAAASKIIVDLIEGRQFCNIFDTRRIYALLTPIKEVKNVAMIAAGFADLLLSSDSKKLRRIQNGQGAVVKYKGKRLGVFRDDKGKLKIIDAVCPHLGCALQWNKDDLSWDCPCHGSRFDTDGNIINGPATSSAQRIESLNIQNSI